MTQVLCPACQKPIAVKGIPLHTRRCAQWLRQIGVPPSEFNFDKHFKRGLFAEGLEEGTHYVQCKLCLAEGQDVRKKRLADHLKKQHGALTTGSYQEQFPEAAVRLSSTAKTRRETVRERFGVDNVFQAGEVKEKSRQTMVAKYGAEHPQQVGEIRERTAQTNLERYGAENPFGSTEVQDRIKQTNLERFGVENPNQCDEVMERRKATNRERHGADHYLQTEQFKERFRQTSQERWGADHPMQTDEGRELFAAPYREAHGVETPLALPEIQQKAYETNLRNHGGQHSQQCPEVLEKARQTWMEKYGVDNPSKAEEIKARIKDVWMAKYGVPFPPQSLWVNREQCFPNKLEQSVDEITSQYVVYAGDGSYWVRHKGASRARNPDFVVLTPEQLQLYRDGTQLNSLRTFAVIEVFGDYWHGPERTGKSRQDHKREVVEYYGKAGIACLVIWESEMKGHPKRVSARISRFLAML